MVLDMKVNTLKGRKKVTVD